MLIGLISESYSLKLQLSLQANFVLKIRSPYQYQAFTNKKEKPKKIFIELKF